MLGAAATAQLLKNHGLPEGGRLIDVKLGSRRARLAADRVSSNEIRLSSDRLQLTIRAQEDGHSIKGTSPAGPVRLLASSTGAITTVEGKVGSMTVYLRSVGQGDGSRNRYISGTVGAQNIHLNQFRQIDGHLLTGYLGSNTFHLREREIPANGLELDPVLYLAALAPSSPPARDINFLA